MLSSLIYLPMPFLTLTSTIGLVFITGIEIYTRIIERIARVSSVAGLIVPLELGADTYPNSLIPMPILTVAMGFTTQMLTVGWLCSLGTM